MKRILHIVTTINRGGAENHLASLVAAQLKQGLDITIAYLKGDGYWTKDFEAKGAKTVPLHLFRYGDPLPVLRLRNLINVLKPDIIHAHMQPAEIYVCLAFLLMRKNRPPLIISKHNDEPFYPGPGHQALGRWVAKQASHIIAISDAVKRFFCSYLAIDPSPITTIHYGIDTLPYRSVPDTKTQALRHEWGIPNDAWVIGTVARLVPQKALHIMIQAYATYLKHAKQPSRLVFVGRGSLEAELKDLAAKLAITDHIVWAGFREDIPVVMNAFDAFALSSIYEGFGLVLLEAMAAAKPIVATEVSAIPEVVRDKETGLLCAINDAYQMAHAFTQLEDAAIRRALGQAGQDRTLQHFTIDKMAEKTLQIYERYADRASRVGNTLAVSAVESPPPRGEG